MPISYGSVCSGIESATQAWHPLGMRAAWFAEMEPFPSAVLAHSYPGVPNLGDMTRLAALVLAGKITAPEVLIGGRPCQAFSVAGMREGLADPRGALTIKYVELADAIDYVRVADGKPPAVDVWENVPGVLSDKGNAFGCFLGALVGESQELQPPGGKWKDAGCVYGPTRTAAWRVLDAQYFGLAQRRRRVFVVASARDGFDPLEVLFEREGVRRDTAPRRGEGQDVTGTAPFGPALQCGCSYVFGEDLGPYGCPNCEGDEGPAVEVFAGIPAFGGHSLEGSVERSATLTAKDSRLDMESETFFIAPTLAGGGRKSGGYSLDDIPITAPALRAQAQSSHRADSEAFIVAGTLSANGKAASSATNQDAESGLLVVHGTQDPGTSSTTAFALGRNNGQENALMVAAFAENSRAEVRYEDGDGGVSGSLSGGGGKAGQGMPTAQVGASVRRLTPRECERLQGMPDNYTLIPWRGKPAEECPDGPRYKAIGNSKAVTVVRWIDQRILRQMA
ncbi:MULTISPECIES: DNA cytosine methyltransferase [unclassified Pseudomonas]|uniref:DNA cytosine methyltransferase n=1 Tax=unclassified Pseudomonas TaxID=196821 RepID=UPI000C2F8BE2|nr:MULTISPECIES: DNA cytosine methyltransferase [unclassified Pseudomonas]MCU1736339.1 DNA cytosine methyltransferase [Pseudomonas sp. 20S_6.2_Bac1]